MGYFRDMAIVLKQEPFREHDAWITLFGETQGKITSVARGCRKWSAKQLGHLEPFHIVEVMIAKGQAFDKLAVAKTVASARPIRGSLPGLMIASALCSYIEVMTRPGLPEPAIFELLLEILALSGSPLTNASPERVRFLINVSAARFLGTQGQLPERDVCTLCQKSMTERGAWDTARHGFMCESCFPSYHRGVGVIPLDPLGIRALRILDRLPLRDWLSVTMPVGVMQQSSLIIESWIEDAPLTPQSWGETRWQPWLSTLSRLTVPVAV